MILSFLEFLFSKPEPDPYAASVMDQIVQPGLLQHRLEEQERYREERKRREKMYEAALLEELHRVPPPHADQVLQYNSDQGVLSWADPEPAITEVECDYCNRVRPRDDSKCEGCGAGRGA